MKNPDIETVKQEVKAMKLVYTSDKMPGYSRKKSGDTFDFYDTKGNKITDEEELLRIKKLVLPPAWTEVWISPKANGHLQATGIDKAGRKQYKYHGDWTAARNEQKHNRMLEFAQALPLIRKQVSKDLRKKGFTKEKVVALAISIMDKTYIRIGNSTYTKLYGSYGLTSLRNKHLKISGNKMLIEFKGKKGVMQQISLTHARLSRMLKKLKDIPGHELFQFYDEEGNKKNLDSDSVNEYITQFTGKDFTAKDFRTWWGTVLAAGHLAEISEQKTGNSPQKNIVETLDFVAQRLGNTRAVCKKYYVHPVLLSRYEEGKLEKYLSKMKTAKQQNGTALMKAEEKIVTAFIKKECAT